MELLELGLEREEQGKGAKWNTNCGVWHGILKWRVEE
jgi:hypothetical protein